MPSEDQRIVHAIRDLDELQGQLLDLILE